MMKKHGFLKGIALGAVVGAAMGVMFDPMTKCEKRAIKRKFENAIEEMMR